MFTTATMHISTGTHAQLPQALCTSLGQYKLFHSHHTHPVADTFYVLFLVHIIHTRLNCVLWRLAASKQHHKIVKTACLFYSFSQPQCALKVQPQGVRLSQGRSGHTRCFEERNVVSKSQIVCIASAGKHMLLQAYVCVWHQTCTGTLYVNKESYDGGYPGICSVC